MRRFTTILGLLLITVLVAAACSGSSSDGDSVASEPAVGGEPEGADHFDVVGEASDQLMADTGGGTESANALSSAVAPSPSPDAATAPAPAETTVGAVPAQVLDGRSVIFQATMSVAVEDVMVATAEAQTLLDSIGLLFGQEATGGDEATAILTFKVRPDQFDTALSRLAGLGEVLSQTRTTDDVTEAVVDLESRIRTAETSVARLQGLMAEAPTLDNIATLEAQLLERETTLEQLRGQLRTLEGQVDLATITVTLTQADLVSSGISLAATAAEGHDLGDTCRGREGIQLDDGAPVTFCYTVTNSGVTELTDVRVIDQALDLTTDDLVVVSGDPAALAAGEAVVYSYEATVDGDLTSRAEASAVTTKGDEVGAVDSVRVSALGDDGLPGFGDAIAASLGALATLGGYLIIAAGALLPFLVLLIPAYLAFRWSRRSHRPAPPAPPSPESPAEDLTPEPTPDPEPQPEPELVG